MPGPLHTRLCDLLGIRHPVLLAPMAQGPGTPELVAAVSRAGGLGVFGAAGLDADRTYAAVRRAVELADGAPVGVNVQIAPRGDGPGRREDVDAALAPVRAELGLPATPPARPRPDPPETLVAAGLEAGARVVSAALGDPGTLAEQARRAGAPLLAMVSSVAEAERSVRAGADVIVAQGAEAGGHRTTFDVEPGVPPPLVGTFALVPLVVDAVSVPVVASGGVADGRGLAAALALGADGVSVGTRFLLARESGAAPVYKARVRAMRETDTVVTDAVTGRPARWLRNEVVSVLAPQAPLGWGVQAEAIADIRAEAARAGRDDLLPMLAGQAGSLAGDEEDAEAIVAAFVEGALEALRRLG